MKMIIMAMLIGALTGVVASFATTLYVLRCWMIQEEERRRRARKAARRSRAAKAGTAGRICGDAPLSAGEEQEGASESNIALFPVERTKTCGKGHIRGAYRGPDGVVTFIGMEGAGADA